MPRCGINPGASCGMHGAVWYIVVQEVVRDRPQTRLASLVSRAGSNKEKHLQESVVTPYATEFKVTDLRITCHSKGIDKFALLLDWE